MVSCTGSRSSFSQPCWCWAEGCIVVQVNEIQRMSSDVIHFLLHVCVGVDQGWDGFHVCVGHVGSRVVHCHMWCSFSSRLICQRSIKQIPPPHNLLVSVLSALCLSKPAIFLSLFSSVAKEQRTSTSSSHAPSLSSHRRTSWSSPTLTRSSLPASLSSTRSFCTLRSVTAYEKETWVKNLSARRRPPRRHQNTPLTFDLLASRAHSVDSICCCRLYWLV